jgi:hypothetical protein
MRLDAQYIVYRSYEFGNAVRQVGKVGEKKEQGKPQKEVVDNCILISMAWRPHHKPSCGGL